MFCVSGFSGVGKDEFCYRLVNKHGAVHTGLTDPAKRHMAEVYGFTRDQLFGPSYMRNAGDCRYPKTVVTAYKGRRTSQSELTLDTSQDSYTDPSKHWWCIDLDLSKGDEVQFLNDLGMETLDHFRHSQQEGYIRLFFEETDPRFFLSPREALQKYCNLMNKMYLFTWVRHGIEVHRKLACFKTDGLNQTRHPVYCYDRMLGLIDNECVIDNVETRREVTGDVITCFSDFRHWHEILYTRQAAKESNEFRPILIRVKRPGIEKAPYNHRSETEQETIPDSEFDYVVMNNGSIEQLSLTVDTIVSQVKDRNNE